MNKLRHVPRRWNFGLDRRVCGVPPGTIGTARLFQFGFGSLIDSQLSRGCPVALRTTHDTLLFAQKKDGGNTPRPISIIEACPAKLRASRPFFLRRVGFCREPGKKSLHERVGLKKGQIFSFLADAYVFHRQSELLADRDYHASLGGPIDL
jgi:hypothetical protein